MSVNVRKELNALERLTVSQLRARYAEAFGEATRTGNRIWLVKRIAWRLQALAEGDLSERARQRTNELANDADLRISPPRAKAAPLLADAPPTTAALRVIGDARLPLPGTILTRQYKGRSIQVQVLRDGFEFEGEIYQSLSAIAKVITGTHWNGYHFFGLRKKAGAV
jgi:hypothetical protein